MPKPHSHATANLLLALALGGIACAQTGTQSFGVHPADIFSAYHLPPFADAAADAPAKAFALLQVGARARALNLSAASATAAWKNAQSILDSDPGQPPSTAHPVIFEGSTASALNQLISTSSSLSFQTSASVITLDQPIQIRRNNVALDLTATHLAGNPAQPYMLRIEAVNCVSITGGLFSGGASGILVNHSSGIRVSNAQITSLIGAGIVITDSTRVTADSNTISWLPHAGIILHRGTTGSLISHNRILNGRGFSNIDAGILLTDREVDLAANSLNIFGPNGYWAVVQPISQRMNSPRDNLIAWNSVSQGLSSGIYCDGVIANVVFSNLLEGNSKEGLCLDNGATANVVISNSIHDNGRRWGDPDRILALDFILDGGRLPDGTAAEKVPGISLDNAAYNFVLGNEISHNFGGGVKLVRTDYFNAIGLNAILNDNEGSGPVFHFFGIEVGAAGGQSPELDFTPSRGNIAFSNVIRGAHYSGIFFGPGSDANDVRYNSIADATAWAIESAPGIVNKSLNNLTDLPSRNIGSGLDPALISAGNPVADPPL